MANWTHFYLVRIEFLGFRYHGWQKQPEFRSVQGMVDKTCAFILGDQPFKTLGCGRTDAKVSADDFVFELFLGHGLVEGEFLAAFNANLPSDIRAKSIHAVGAEFNVIQQAKVKEYHYYFSSGEKSHPFNAPLIRDFGKALDIDLMKAGARLFEGRHNFKRYASKPSANTVFEREILTCRITENDRLVGSFLARNSYVLKIRSTGFLTYQVRLMMGVLVDVGRGSMSLSELTESLTNFEGRQMRHIAPSSGLVLHQVSYD